jgi:chromate transporter
MTPTTPSLKSNPTLWGLFKYFLYLGTVGYGGPMALVGYMRRDLCEDRKWIEHSDFMNGLALASLCPGPLATQLAIYIGWFHNKLIGATVILIAFTLPAFLMMLTLAVAYTNATHLGWIQWAFYGISASVIAIVIHHAFHMSKMIVERNHWLWGIFIFNILITWVTTLSIFWFFLISGIIVWLIKFPPRFISLPIFLPTLQVTFEGLTNHHLLLKLFLYFAWAGTVVFGSGFAIIPFIHEGVVQHYHWLTERQFLDAIAMGMATPGPIVLAVTFMGYLIAGIKGAIVTALGILLPCYLLVILLAPHFNRIAHHEGVRAFVQGLTVAVAGGITGTSLLLGKNAIVDWMTLSIFLGTLISMYKLPRLKEPILLLIAAIVGIIIKGI